MSTFPPSTSLLRKLYFYKCAHTLTISQTGKECINTQKMHIRSLELPGWRIKWRWGIPLSFKKEIHQGSLHLSLLRELLEFSRLFFPPFWKLTFIPYYQQMRSTFIIFISKKSMLFKLWTPSISVKQKCTDHKETWIACIIGKG